MKILINILLILISVTSYAQSADLKGHVMFREDKSDFPGAKLVLLKDKKVISECETDKNGLFHFLNIAVGTYDLLLRYKDFNEKIIPNIYVASSMNNLDIVYPDPCVASEKVCPYNHTDSIIPMAYGMPGAETMKMAEKGLVHLGGCVVSECSPRWYCKKHDIIF